MIAYGLILLLVLTLAGVIFYLRHNSRDRVITRQREKESKARERRNG
jgi:uncharacterized membrane protein YqjE